MSVHCHSRHTALPQCDTHNTALLFYFSFFSLFHCFFFCNVLFTFIRLHFLQSNSRASEQRENCFAGWLLSAPALKIAPSSQCQNLSFRIRNMNQALIFGSLKRILSSPIWLKFLEKVRRAVCTFAVSLFLIDSLRKTWKQRSMDDYWLMVFKKKLIHNLTGALSKPIPLVKRSSEQFLFLRLFIWKALIHSLPTIEKSHSKYTKNLFWP